MHFNADVDLDTVLFEGNNYVGDRTVLRDCSLGFGSYVADQSVLYATDIGKFCSISSDVRIVVGTHPSSIFVSTHPAFFSSSNPSGVSYVSETLFEEVRYSDQDMKRLVTIGNDVWIGYGARIFSGVTIGDGAIVGAGAIVTKSIEPYSIVGGIPAKLIRKRFDDDTITFLCGFKWWDQCEDWIQKHAVEFRDIDMFVQENNKRG